MTKKNKILLIRLSIAIVLWVLAICLEHTLPETEPLFEVLYAVIYAVAYLIAGYDILWGALRNIFQGKFLDEYFLMAIASLGAFALRAFGDAEYLEAVAVMVFFQVGEVFQGIAVEKSRNAIMDTMDLKVTKCYLESGEELEPEDVQIGQRIVVRPGEMVPLDGISRTSGSINVASLTGEALDVDINDGDTVLSGSINTTTPIVVEVTKEYYDSTAAKILDMVENATMKKAKSEQFITKFARFYTPTVVLLALILAFIPPLFMGFKENFSFWFKSALSCLVVSCPCALVVSVPLSYFAGIGANAKKKIIIKGGSYLEDLAICDTMILDKTGTLTKASFEITKIIGDNTEEILKIAKGLEKNSTHPLAQAIQKVEGEAYEFVIEETPGFGIIGTKDGIPYVCGSSKLLRNNGIEPLEIDEAGSILYIAKDKKCIGAIILEDVLKDEAIENIRALRQMGKRIVVLSGDTKKSVESICNRLEIKEYYYSLLPADKVAKVEEIIKSKTSGKVLFVGDGINDAPVLALADIGVSMGQIGSDAAVEASDVVILNDNLQALPNMLKISRKTKRIVLENIIFTICIKILALVLCGMHILAMSWAIFADVGVCVIAVLNAMRALKIK